MDFSSWPAMAYTVLPVVAYAGLLIGGVFVVYRLVTGAWHPATAVPMGWALCPVALVSGMIVATIVTPDWNPITMFVFWIPFFTIGAWALYFSVFTQRGLDRAKASRRALLLSVPSLLLAPLVAMAVLLFPGL